MVHRVWILGGDARTPYMMEKLQSMGYELTYSGLPSSLASTVTAPYKKDLILNEEAIVLPVKGWSRVVRETVAYMDEETIKSWAQVPIFVGQIDELMDHYQQKYMWNAIAYNHLEPFISINSQATAQGLLAYILMHTNTLIQFQRVLLIGYGESGQAIASMVGPLVKKMTVVARREESREKAKQNGFDSIEYDQIKDVIGQYDCLINTVPTTVITKPMMQMAKGHLQLFEIASPPGGIDREEAMFQNLKIIDLPGLPSLYAPQSSGYALAETLRKEFMYGK